MKSKNTNDVKSTKKKSFKKWGSVFCAIIIITILFYSFVYEKDDEPPPIGINLAMSFPEDEGAHEQMLEIWTFSGFFKTAGGHSFGYQVSYFNSGIRTVAFTDENNLTGKKYYSSRNYPDDVRQPSLNIEASNESLDISYKNGLITDAWQAVDSDEYNLNSIMFEGSQELVRLNVTLQSSKDPVLLGDENGKTWLNEYGTIHSYFQSKIEISGTILLQDVQYSISGQAWIEHSWGDWSIFNTETWNVVLSNGYELYVSKIYDQNSEIILERHYLVNMDGSFELDVYSGLVSYSDFNNMNSSVQNLKYWLDPTDSAGQRAYSHSWRIVSEKNNYNFTLEPTVDNQRAATAWAGTCEVTGFFKGRSVTGNCYANLVKSYSSTLMISEVHDNFQSLGIPNDPVTVTAAVSDNLPISDVTLFYRIDNGTEQSLDMTFGELGWYVTIPGQALQTEVEYWIVAKDLADKMEESISYFYRVEI